MNPLMCATNYLNKFIFIIFFTVLITGCVNTNLHDDFYQGDLCKEIYNLYGIDCNSIIWDDQNFNYKEFVPSAKVILAKKILEKNKEINEHGDSINKYIIRIGVEFPEIPYWTKIPELNFTSENNRDTCYFINPPTVENPPSKITRKGGVVDENGRVILNIGINTVNNTPRIIKLSISNYIIAYAKKDFFSYYMHYEYYRKTLDMNILVNAPDFNYPDNGFDNNLRGFIYFVIWTSVFLIILLSVFLPTWIHENRMDTKYVLYGIKANRKDNSDFVTGLLYVFPFIWILGIIFIINNDFFLFKDISEQILTWKWYFIVLFMIGIVASVTFVMYLIDKKTNRIL